MARPALEVADIFRDHGAAWRHANRGHVSLLQLKVMSAIESCRTAALGGHVARCEDCAHTTIAYNSCRNRHCPKCHAGESIRRFLIHVLPKGFHRIRHYGLFASANPAETIARARELLGLAAPAFEEAAEIDPATAQPIEI